MSATFNDTLTDISDTIVGFGNQIPDPSIAPTSQLNEMTQTHLQEMKTKRLVVAIVIIAVFVTLTIFVIKSKK